MMSSVSLTGSIFGHGLLGVLLTSNYTNSPSNQVLFCSNRGMQGGGEELEHKLELNDCNDYLH